jgi:uncharacterized protein (DUF2237 family)
MASGGMPRAGGAQTADMSVRGDFMTRDRWCLCAPVGRKHPKPAKRPAWCCALITRRLLSYCSLADLKRYAVDLA